MSRLSERIFREAAIERLSSPDQLDQVVGITRPVDWIAALVAALAIAALVAWGFLGRIPTRVAGEGILVGGGGRIVDAVSAAAGRLSSVDVAVGDHVTRGQLVAHLSQAEIEERYGAAIAVLHEREREHAELVAEIDQELASKAASFEARKAGLEQAIATAEDRVATVSADIKTLEGMIKQGLTTQPDLEQMRVELYAARQRITDSKNEIMALEADKVDREAQRAHDKLVSQFRVDDARRESEALADTLDRETRVLSPSDGQVTEIKVSPGAVLAVGTPVAAIETAENALQVDLYLPADNGKTVKPGMGVRIEPSTVKREEFGALLGTVQSISEFPVTPEGMAAALHNADLIKHFAAMGVLYETVVRLEPDADSASGYRWSSGHGPPQRLTPGTLVKAEIITRERQPLDLILPLIRRVTDSD